MPDVTTGFRICRDRVRALGYRVEEVPGWESRGKGMVTPRVDVNHHDAIPGPSPVAGLRVCTFGRPGLENALCNTYGERGRNAAIWLVAAGVAWHAGSGGWAGWSGNSRALGRENANDGRGEPWHPDALAVQRVWDRVQAEVFGLPWSHYCEHKEWAPTRKPDRAGISGAAWRHEIAHLPLGPTPTPIPAPIEEDEDMLLFWHKGAVYLFSGGKRSGWGLSPQTVDALKTQGVKLAGKPEDDNTLFHQTPAFK